MPLRFHSGRAAPLALAAAAAIGTLTLAIAPGCKSAPAPTSAPVSAPGCGGELAKTILGGAGPSKEKATVTAPSASSVATSRDGAGAQPCANACGPDSKGLCVADAEVAPLKVDDGGAASATLRVCNKGGKDEPLGLDIGNFVATSWDGSSFALGPAPTLSVDPNSDAVPAKPANPLPAGQCAKVRVAATGLSDAGLMRATLSQGATALATIWAFKPTTPFRVNADGPNPGKLALSVNQAGTGGQTSVELPIVNADGLAYQVDWVFELGDAIIARGSEPLAPGGRARLCAKFDAAAQERLFGWRDSGFITPNRKEGRLLLTRHADGPMKNTKMDAKEIAITASLGHYENGVTQGVANAFYVFVTLLCGVLASLGINFAMPMWRKKVGLKQALSTQERSLNGQGSLIDSRTLSALRLELRRLWSALSAQWVFLPDTEAALPAIEARIKALAQRIDITRSARRELAALKGRGLLALHESDQVESLCLSALQIAEAPAPGDADLQKAQASLAQAATLASAATGTPSTEAVAALEKRRATLVAALAQLGALPPKPAEAAAASSPTPEPKPDEAPTQADAQAASKPEPSAGAEKMWAELTSPLDKFKTFAIDQTPSRRQYIDDSERVWVAERLWEYAQLIRGADTPGLYDNRLDRGQSLLACLAQGPKWSPAEASQTLRQIAQNVSAEEIAKVLSAGGAGGPRIEIDPPHPVALQIAEMRVRLADPGLDTSDARKSIECVWSVDGKTQDARGFCAFQFFEPKGLPVWSAKARRTFTVKATLSRGGVALPALDATQVELTPNRDYFKGSTWLSAASLLITVIVVTIGLLAAAQEKLQTLEVFAGTVALLTLGFGADVVKRSLSKT